MATTYVETVLNELVNAETIDEVIEGLIPVLNDEVVEYENDENEFSGHTRQSSWQYRNRRAQMRKHTFTILFWRSLQGLEREHTSEEIRQRLRTRFKSVITDVLKDIAVEKMMSEQE